MSIEREEKLIRAFLVTTHNCVNGHLSTVDARVEAVKRELREANLETYALRVAKPGERFVANNSKFSVWKAPQQECYGPRLIVRTRSAKVAKPAVVVTSTKPSTPSAPFEKRFYNESVISYETAPDQGFQAFFSLEDRQVTITHTTEKVVKTYKAAAHPDDQYDEQFGFELAAARLWAVALGLEAIQDFINFRAYVWGIKGWGVLDLAQFHERWPRVVSDLLAASKDPSFRQRVVEVQKLPVFDPRVVAFAKLNNLELTGIAKLLEREKVRIVDFRKAKCGESFVTDYLTVGHNNLPSRNDWASERPIVETVVAGSADAVVGKSLLDVKTTSRTPETPFEIITRYKETTKRGKEDRKTALQLWKDLKDAGYTPIDVRDAKKGDKFFWSNFCNEVLPVDGDGWEGSDDPALILAKTVTKTPVTPAPEPTQEDRWIDQESEDWHEGETAAKRAARVRAFLKEKSLKVVDYREP